MVGRRLEYTDYFMCGGLAGICCDVFIHPFDTVRCRMQTHYGTKATAPYRGLWHAFSTIFRTEGPRALYRGFGIVSVLTIPANGLYYGTYEVCKDVLGDEPYAHFASGLGAEFAISVVYVPLDVVKQRVQMHTSSSHPEYGNSYRSLRTVVRAGGIRGIYRGYGAAMAVYLPFTSLYFTTYEQTQKFLRNQVMSTERTSLDSNHDLPGYCHLLGAAFASGLSAFVTCPLDVVKTRMQTRDSTSGGYRNVWHAIQSIWTTEGPRAFTKGVVPRVALFTPGLAISMTAYEKFKELRLGEA